MGLKKSIVIKNEYTNNARSKAGKGSRGASPGAYVMRYMAREDATEVVAPVKFDTGVFVRYMAREGATSDLKAKRDDFLQDASAFGSPLVLKHRFRKMDKLSGRAFGNKSLSLSQSELVESSELIQKAFDEGHSVQKIILSFTEEYLRDTGVLDPKFKHGGRGSYKGFIDQLKLREAITRGVNDMTKTGRFISPEWVGTIQHDTSHIHSHIALVDKEFSEYRMKSDGADRGKINEREKSVFRKGINYALEDMRDLKSFHKQTSLERQNVVSFVKDYAYSTIKDNSQMQLLIASLPTDRSVWRYGTNRESMKYPNEIAKSIIEDTFKKEPVDSGYNSAMISVREYADESSRINKYGPRKREELIKNGRERIIERSVNGLYKTIKEIDDNQLHVRTSMIDIQSSSEDELKNALNTSANNNSSDDFDPASFALRVRGYNKRQEIHTDNSLSFYDLAKGFDDAEDAGFVDDSAISMRLFYENEQRYHMKLTDKYRFFLSFHNDVDRKNVKIMKPIYERLSNEFREIINTDENNINRKNDYKKDLKDYTFKCFALGVGTSREWESIVDFDIDSNKVETKFVLPIRPRTRLEMLTEDHFNSVKALDVHHLGLDYYNKNNLQISATNALNFANAYEDRKFTSELARVYVDSTGQNLVELNKAEKDIVSMEVAVDKAINEGLIESITIEDLANIDERQRYTISSDYSLDVVEDVRQILDDIDIVSDIEDKIEDKALE